MKFPTKSKILLIGKGESTLKFKESIEEFIRNNDVFVICLNINQNIDNNLVDFHTVCHPIRIISEFKKYSNLKNTFIIPKSSLKNSNDSMFKNVKVIDYSLKLQEDKISCKKNYAVIPNFNVLGYSLAISLKMMAKEIYLVGFDGFTIGDFRQNEVQNIIDIFLRDYPKTSLCSLTPINI